jgi:hypothetical protein
MPGRTLQSPGCFDAFEAAATQQGLHKQKPPSEGLKKFDGVAEDLM